MAITQFPVFLKPHICTPHLVSTGSEPRGRDPERMTDGQKGAHPTGADTEGCHPSVPLDRAAGPRGNGMGGVGGQGPPSLLPNRLSAQSTKKA